MTTFDREMQQALLADAQKLRDMGEECADPIFGSLSSEQRATIETPAPVTFPRAQFVALDLDGEAYLAEFRHDCTPLMRAWVAQDLASFFDLCEPSRQTIKDDENDALIVAEQLAAEELRRPLNVYERRVLGEVVRDVLCAAIITRDTEQARQAELAREVL
jgi:hypothetical protein